jgi:hypothetical protein
VVCCVDCAVHVAVAGSKSVRICCVTSVLVDFVAQHCEWLEGAVSTPRCSNFAIILQQFGSNSALLSLLYWT